ncbi:hypothetical protein NL676_024198 [Syzygium grande]|nr:hypothetical protein NL676_024198 [Syzygium grande]
MDGSPPEAAKRPSPAMSRSSSSSKFFRCFKPAVADDDGGNEEGKRGSDEPLFAYVATKEDDGRVVSKIPPGGEGDDGSDDRRKKKKKKGLKLFSRASKAVFSETSLEKKMQKRKSTKDSLESINNLSTKADRILKLMHQNSGGRVSDNDDVWITESDASTSLHSSIATTTSPSLSSSRFNLSAVEDGKERPLSAENSAICLLLLTLLVLVLWGKVCAIVCTSTWLFLVPRWSIINCTKSPLENCDDSSYVDSAEYKKKIILEGLLQRKRSRGAQPS